MILSPYPEALAREAEDIDENGDPTTPFVRKSCRDGVCAYYPAPERHLDGVPARHGRRGG